MRKLLSQEGKKYMNIAKFPTRLANYLLFGFSISIAVSFFVSSYSTVRIANTLSYKSNDGWCDPILEGLRDHCFGDFYAPLRFANSANPWDGIISNYPPIGFILMKPFAFMNTTIPGRTALLLFLFISILCLVFPIIHMYKMKLASNFALGIALLVTLTSGPSITLIDRGNNLVFAFPAIYMFFYKIWQGKYSTAIYYGVFFSVLKPQLFVLALLLLGMKKYWLILRWIGLASLLTVLSFSFYPADFPRNLLKWIDSAIRYQDYSAVGVLQPVNMSIKSSIDVFANIFGTTVNPIITSTIVYALLFWSIFIILRNFSSRTFEMNSFLIVLIPILFVGTAFHYYLILLLIPLYMMLNFNPEADRFHATVSTSSTKLNLISYAYVILLIPVTIPWSSLGHFQGRGWENISIHWLLAQFSLSIIGIFLMLEKPIKR
jgi:hypothetical protein